MGLIYIIRLFVNELAETPIYQQIVDSIAREIRTGALAPGYKLPTVRMLAEQCGASQGTVKHAYDTLEQLGLLEKTQGRGTFVCGRVSGGPLSKKEQALEAIDKLLDQMEALSFSAKDIRIFLDLKMREREHAHRNVRLGAVDCSPEALAAMCRQISLLAHVDVYEYLLGPVLESAQRFDPEMDLVVTTPTHHALLSEKMHADKQPIQLVMALSTATALELSRIPENAAAGVLCASERFGRIIVRTCEKYCNLSAPPAMGIFGEHEKTWALIREADYLIVPPQYLKFCSKQEQPLIRKFAEKKPLILFQYQIEKGSLLYLEGQVEKAYQRSQNK